MATGRTTPNSLRFYMDGYDLSGYTQNVGQMSQEFDAEPISALTDAVRNALISQGAVSIGDLNGIFDNTASSGLHAVAAGAGGNRSILIPVGIRAAPEDGDPAFMCELMQLGYNSAPVMGQTVAVNVPFGKNYGAGTSQQFNKAWGLLLHAKQAETAVNTGTGFEDFAAAATTRGGYMVYQIFTSNGTVTVKAQDAATNANGSFSDISGATSGSVDASATPKHGLVALSQTATVRRYLRWQIVLGTATTVTFALGFVRGQ